MNTDFVVSYVDELMNGEYVATAVVAPRGGEEVFRGRLNPLKREERSAFIRDLAGAVGCGDADFNGLAKAMHKALTERGKSVMCGPVVTRMSDVVQKPVEWLWRQRFGLGKLNVICGDPGLGKSFLTLDMIARVTTGSPWPDEDVAGVAPLGSAVLVSAEDAVDDTIAPAFRPRVRTCGGSSS